MRHKIYPLPLATVLGAISASVHLGVSQHLVSSCAGGSHTCAVFLGGAIKCWGSNEFGQLGQGDVLDRGNSSKNLGNSLPFIELGQGRKAAAVDCSLTHTCALLEDGHVKCWGSNEYGQLGLGDSLNRGDGRSEMGDNLPHVELGTDRLAVSVATGQFHTCCLLDDGSIKCFGHNGFGQLGQGDQVYRGEQAAGMGDALLAIRLGSAQTVSTFVTCGAWHSCAILSNGAIKCWGGNHQGQLGQGDTEHRGSTNTEMGISLPQIELGTNISAVSLSCGSWHTCSLHEDGSARCWGHNQDWQLGIVDPFRRGDQVGEMGDALPAIGFGPGRTAQGLWCGDRHTCAILDDKTTKCWGYNTYGTLGYGDILRRGGDTGLLPDSVPGVNLGSGSSAVALSLGYWHSCAILADGNAKCWGLNSRGQLATGDLLTRGDVGGQMGDSLPTALVGCRQGFELSSTNSSEDVCTDVDECTRFLDDCNGDSVCVNTQGSFSCACNPGYSQGLGGVGTCPGCVSVSELCVPCPAQQYKPLLGVGQCRQCPQGSGTAGGGAAACACSPGFFNYSEPAGCRVCRSGFYCEGAGHVALCPNKSESAAGGGSVDDCICESGYRKGTDEAGAVACVPSRSHLAVIVSLAVLLPLALCAVLAWIMQRYRPQRRVETEADLLREAEEGRRALEGEKARLQEEEAKAMARDKEIKALQGQEGHWQGETELTLCEHNRARKFCSECRGSRKYLSGSALQSAGRTEESSKEVLFVNVGSRRHLLGGGEDSPGGGLRAGGPAAPGRAGDSDRDGAGESAGGNAARAESGGLAAAHGGSRRQLTEWSRSRRDLKETEQRAGGSSRHLAA